MKCTICNSDIRGRYLIDAWQQPICAHHTVEYCSACGRFVKPSDLHLPDGRCLCSFCQPSIVTTPQHIEWVEIRVRAILASHGITDISQNVPIHIVSPAEMARKNRSKQINLLQPGLTLTAQMMGLFFSKCRHTIYMFDYLPKVQFAGVLGHEMLHVWQNEKGISLPPPLTEGFCNVGSYVVYQSIGNELAKYYVKRLEENTDPVYGDGFKEVKRIYAERQDLLKTVERISYMKL